MYRRIRRFSLSGLYAITLALTSSCHPNPSAQSPGPTPPEPSENKPVPPAKNEVGRLSDTDFIKLHCQTPTPIDKIRKQIKTELDLYKADHPELFTVESEVTIEVCFHILTKTTGGRVIGTVSDDALNKLIDVLNDAFAGNQKPAAGSIPAGFEAAPTHFQFHLAEVDRPEGDPGYDPSWFQTIINDRPTELACKTFCKARPHGGGHTDPKILHIFTADLPDGVEGVSTLPKDATVGEDGRELDGIVCRYTDIKDPNNSPPNNEGDIFVHETGHWLGLFHTFQDGCTFPNDYMADTPPESLPFRGCPTAIGSTTVNSCPNQPPAPVENFMDYTDDACMYRFTPNQADRMRTAWFKFRSP